MEVREFYRRVDGNYEDVLRRFMDEKRVVKYLRLFLQDQSFEQLRDAMEQGDLEAAFRAAHSLKGICLNLGLTSLQKSSSELTENLRGRKADSNTPGLFEKTERDYQNAAAVIRELTDSQNT